MPKISYKDFVKEKDLFGKGKKSAEEFLKSLDKIEVGAVKTAQSLQKLLKAQEAPKTNKAIKEREKLVKKTNDTTKTLNATREATITINKKILAENKKLKVLNSDRIQQAVELQRLTKKQNAINKDTDILTSKQTGTLEKLAASSRKLKREREGLNLETAKGRKRILEINKALDKNNEKVKKNSSALEKQKINVGNYSESIKDAAGQLGFLTPIMTALNTVRGFANAILKTNTVEEGANTVSKEANAAATVQLTTAQKAMNFATGAGTKALKLFRLALVSTGVGALVIALGGLVAFLTSTQRGLDKVAVAGAGVSTFFAVIRDRLSLVGEAFTLLFKKDISGFFEKIAESVEGAADEIKDKTEAALELERALQRVERVENDLIVVRAAARAESAKLRIIAGDILQTTTKRIAAAREALKVEEASGAVAIAIQKERLKTILTVNGVLINSEQLNEKIAGIREKSLNLEIDSEEEILALLDKKLVKIGEVGLTQSKEDERREALEAIAKIFELEAETDKKRKKLVSLTSSILDQEARKRITVERLRITTIQDLEKKAIATQLTNFENIRLEVSRLGLDIEIFEEEHQRALEAIREKFRQKKIEADKRIAAIEKSEKLKELQVLEELEKARREGRLDEIQRQIDAEAEAVEKGNEDALKTSQELIEKEFDEREEALKRAAQFRLDNEELTADEILTIEQQLQNDLKNLEDEELQRIKDLNANRIKEEEKTLASILNKNKKFIDDVGREILAQNRKEDQEDIDKIDTEIKRLEKSIETQEELAKNGNDNIAEAERAALVKAQLERKRELKKQADIEEAIQLSLAFINNYSERSKTNPDTALVLALRDIGLAKGVATGIRTVAGFIDGTENVADSLGKANRPGEDGYDIRVDGRERIVNPEDNKLMGSIKNHDLAKLAYNYRTGKLSMNAHQFSEVGATNNINTVQYNFRPIVDEMSRQTKQIGQDLKRYQSTVTTNYNEQGEAVRTIIRDHERLTTIFKQRTRGPI